MGPDGIRFYTELKSVTTHWFGEDEAECKVDTWDGMIEVREDKK
jgi:malonate-semialdehyde dehydrogenase (acetylating)/methylmalonate-semialdehyde dehydrogenase